MVLRNLLPCKTLSFKTSLNILDNQRNSVRLSRVSCESSLSFQIQYENPYWVLSRLLGSFKTQENKESAVVSTCRSPTRESPIDLGWAARNTSRLDSVAVTLNEKTSTGPLTPTRLVADSRGRAPALFVGSAKADDRYFLSGLSIINSEGDPSSGYNFLSICQWNDDESNWDTYTWSGADAGSLSNQIIKGFGYKAASYLVSSGNDPTDKVFCEPNAGPLGWENGQNPSPASPLYSSTWLDFAGYITTKGQARRWVDNRYVAPLAEPCALLENQPEELTTRLRDILAKKVPTASKKTDQAICNLDGI